MSLSSDLISQFVKATKDDAPSNNESTMYGTTVEYNGSVYVKLDGSDLLTPINTTTDTKPGERVTVMLKNHTATVTGNISSPAARTDDVKEIGSQISEFEIVMAYSVTTENLEAANATIESLRAKVAKITDLEVLNADIDKLEAKFANLTYVSAKDVEALNADIENLQAKFGEFTNVSTEDLEALNAEIATLKGYTADFTYVSADVLQAFKASIKELETEKISAKDADLKYANIDFSNIGKAAMEYFYATSGLIKGVTIGDAEIAGELVGVTIKGDLIEGNTIKADKLVIRDDDTGLYYKLNFLGGAFTNPEEVPVDTLHGSVITAHSITAEKVSVKDLVAFDATIGGFTITDNSISTVVKDSAGNSIRGIYLDNDGQLSVGDATNFLKYYKDQNGVYRLEISAGSITLGTSGKNLETTVDEVTELIDGLQVGARNLIRNSTNLLFDNYYFTGPFKIVYDEDIGKLAIVCGASGSRDNAGNVLLKTSHSVIDDGAGNLKIL